jgi:hypothetical protein
LARSKLRYFIVKRIIILYTLLVVLYLLLVRERWYALTGLTAGTLYSGLRFGLIEYSFSSLLSKNSKPIAVHILLLITIGSMTGLIVLLAISIKLNIWLFAGTVSGILTAPAVIAINGITEALGISNNNFR